MSAGLFKREVYAKKTCPMSGVYLDDGKGAVQTWTVITCPSCRRVFSGSLLRRGARAMIPYHHRPRP